MKLVGYEYGGTWIFNPPVSAQPIMTIGPDRTEWDFVAEPPKDINRISFYARDHSGLRQPHTGEARGSFVEED